MGRREEVGRRVLGKSVVRRVAERMGYAGMIMWFFVWTPWGLSVPLEVELDSGVVVNVVVSENRAAHLESELRNSQGRRTGELDIHSATCGELYGIMMLMIRFDVMRGK